MSTRLDLLRPHLSKYKRRFTVLDFGAGINVPAIGAEIAREFDAVVVCVEKDIKTPELSPRTMWLAKEFTVDDLVLMSECEHFDVVIGFNVAHWFSKDTFKVVDTLRRMGRYVFLQVPRPDDEKAAEVFGETTLTILNNYFTRSGWDWKHLGDTVQFPQHAPRPLWMFENTIDKRLTRTCVDAHANSADTVIMPYLSTCRAFLKGSFRDWIPGINLANFLKWNGVYPFRTVIAQMISNYVLPLTKHGDIAPHNFVFDGESVYLVDGHEGWGGDDAKNMQLTIQKVLEG